MTTPDTRPYGKKLALMSLPFWIISILCLVYGIATGSAFTTVCAAAATLAFPLTVWRRRHPPS